MGGRGYWEGDAGILQLSVPNPSPPPLLGARRGSVGAGSEEAVGQGGWVAFFWATLFSRWDDCENTMKFSPLNYLTD